MRLAPLLILLALPAGSAFAQNRAALPNDLPLPGYWEMTTNVQSIIHDTKTERRCYGPADVPRLVQPCNHHYNCEYSTQEARNGHLTLKGQWVSKKNGQTIDVSGSGTYTRESLNASAKMHTSFLGLPLSGTGQITAHRISAECPADAKKG
jgi:Protein of unknown function (DUF3617)